VDADAGGDLLRLRDVVQELGRYSEPLDHDLGYVVGGVADLLYVLDDLQDTGHLLGVGVAPGGEDREAPHIEDEVIEAFLEPEDLLGEVFGVVEDRGVGQVNHQLRGVFRLG
jgi:hypothetical protein